MSYKEKKKPIHFWDGLKTRLISQMLNICHFAKGKLLKTECWIYMCLQMEIIIHKLINISIGYSVWIFAFCDDLDLSTYPTSVNRKWKCCWLASIFLKIKKYNYWPRIRNMIQEKDSFLLILSSQCLANANLAPKKHLPRGSHQESSFFDLSHSWAL